MAYTVDRALSTSDSKARLSAGRSVCAGGSGSCSESRSGSSASCTCWPASWARAGGPPRAPASASSASPSSCSVVRASGSFNPLWFCFGLICHFVFPERKSRVPLPYIHCTCCYFHSSFAPLPFTKM